MLRGRAAVLVPCGLLPCKGAIAGRQDISPPGRVLPDVLRRYIRFDGWAPQSLAYETRAGSGRTRASRQAPRRKAASRQEPDR